MPNLNEALQNLAKAGQKALITIINGLTVVHAELEKIQEEVERSLAETETSFSGAMISTAACELAHMFDSNKQGLIVCLEKELEPKKYADRITMKELETAIQKNLRLLAAVDQQLAIKKAEQQESANSVATAILGGAAIGVAVYAGSTVYKHIYGDSASAADEPVTPPAAAAAGGSNPRGRARSTGRGSRSSARR